MLERRKHLRREQIRQAFGAQVREVLMVGKIHGIAAQGTGRIDQRRVLFLSHRDSPNQFLLCAPRSASAAAGPP